MSGRATARAGGFAAALFALALLSGCSTIPELRVADADIPRARELTHVTFYPQEEYQCGPAALATVLNSADVRVLPAHLVPLVYLPEREGSLQLELVAATRRHERVPYPLRPEREAIVREVAAGNPVLVLQNLGLNWVPVWHYAVVVGYDLDRQEFILRSGREPRLATDFTTFERTWARGGHWALVVTDAHRLPSTADERDYLLAVAPLEGKGPTPGQAALTAYQNALQRWPNSNAARFGMANVRYGRGELDEAERQYREIIARDPQHAAAWNNLAQVLLDQDQLQEAEQAVVRALSLGGVSHTANQTLVQIHARKAAIRPRLP